MISVGRISAIHNSARNLSLFSAPLISENAICFELVHPPETAYFFQVFPMILGFQNVRFHVLRKALDAFGMIDVELQVIRIEVITLEDSGRMGPKGLVYDRFNAVGWNDGLLRVSLDVLGGNKFFRDHDDSPARLRLFF